MQNALRILFLLVFFPPTFAWAEEVWLEFEPVEVTLSGTILVEEHFGPPGYGETPDQDNLEKAVILVLENPINIKGDPGSELNNQDILGVTQIQLVFGFEITDLESFQGKELSLRGTLFRPHTGHHRAEVLMSVSYLTRPKQKIKSFKIF